MYYTTFHLKWIDDNGSTENILERYDRVYESFDFILNDLMWWYTRGSKMRDLLETGDHHEFWDGKSHTGCESVDERISNRMTGDADSFFNVMTEKMKDAEHLDWETLTGETFNALVQNFGIERIISSGFFSQQMVKYLTADFFNGQTAGTLNKLFALRVQNESLFLSLLSDKIFIYFNPQTISAAVNVFWTKYPNELHSLFNRFTAKQVKDIDKSSLVAVEVTALNIIFVSGLSAEQLGYQTDTWLSRLTARQVSAINPDAILGLGSRLGTLTDAQLQLLSYTQVIKISGEQFSSFSDKLQKFILVLVGGSLNAAVLNTLSSEKAKLITRIQVENWTVDTIKSLSNQSVSQLADDVIWSFDLQQLGAIQGGINAINSTAVIGLNQEKYNKLAEGQRIDPNAPKPLYLQSSEQLTNISKEVLRKLPPAAIASLTVSQLAMLTKVQALNIDALQLIKLTKEQISSLVSHPLAGMSPEDLGKLDVNIFREIQPETVETFNIGQFQALTALDVKALNSQCVRSIQPVVFALLGLNDFRKFSVTQLRWFTADQLKSLSQTNRRYLVDAANVRANLNYIASVFRSGNPVCGMDAPSTIRRNLYSLSNTTRAMIGLVNGRTSYVDSWEGFSDKSVSAGRRSGIRENAPTSPGNINDDNWQAQRLERNVQNLKEFKARVAASRQVAQSGRLLSTFEGGLAAASYAYKADIDGNTTLKGVGDILAALAAVASALQVPYVVVVQIYTDYLNGKNNYFKNNYRDLWTQAAELAILRADYTKKLVGANPTRLANTYNTKFIELRRKLYISDPQLFGLLIERYLAKHRMPLPGTEADITAAIGEIRRVGAEIGYSGGDNFGAALVSNEIEHCVRLIKAFDTPSIGKLSSEDTIVFGTHLNNAIIGKFLLDVNDATIRQILHDDSELAEKASARAEASKTQLFRGSNATFDILQTLVDQSDNEASKNKFKSDYEGASVAAGLQEIRDKNLFTEGNAGIQNSVVKSQTITKISNFIKQRTGRGTIVDFIPSPTQSADQVVLDSNSSDLSNRASDNLLASRNATRTNIEEFKITPTGKVDRVLKNGGIFALANFTGLASSSYALGISDKDDKAAYSLAVANVLAAAGVTALDLADIFIGGQEGTKSVKDSAGKGGYKVYSRGMQIGMGAFQTALMLTSMGLELNTLGRAYEKDKKSKGNQIALFGAVAVDTLMVALLVAGMVGGPITMVASIVIGLILPNFQSIARAEDLKATHDKLYSQGLSNMAHVITILRNAAIEGAAPITNWNTRLIDQCMRKVRDYMNGVNEVRDMDEHIIDNTPVDRFIESVCQAFEYQMRTDNENTSRNNDGVATGLILNLKDQILAENKTTESSHKVLDKIVFISIQAADSSDHWLTNKQYSDGYTESYLKYFASVLNVSGDGRTGSDINSNAYTYSTKTGWIDQVVKINSNGNIKSKTAIEVTSDASFSGSLTIDASDAVQDLSVVVFANKNIQITGGHGVTDYTYYVDSRDPIKGKLCLKSAKKVEGAEGDVRISILRYVVGAGDLGGVIVDMNNVEAGIFVVGSTGQNIVTGNAAGQVYASNGGIDNITMTGGKSEVTVGGRGSNVTLGGGDNTLRVQLGINPDSQKAQALFDGGDASLATYRWIAGVDKDKEFRSELGCYADGKEITIADFVNLALVSSGRNTISFSSVADGLKVELTDPDSWSTVATLTAEVQDAAKFKNFSNFVGSSQGDNIVISKSKKLNEIHLGHGANDVSIADSTGLTIFYTGVQSNNIYSYNSTFSAVSTDGVGTIYLTQKSKLMARLDGYVDKIVANDGSANILNLFTGLGSHRIDTDNVTTGVITLNPLITNNFTSLVDQSAVGRSGALTTDTGATMDATFTVYLSALMETLAVSLDGDFSKIHFVDTNGSNRQFDYGFSSGALWDNKTSSSAKNANFILLDFRYDWVQSFVTVGAIVTQTKKMFESKYYSDVSLTFNSYIALNEIVGQLFLNQKPNSKGDVVDSNKNGISTIIHESESFSVLGDGNVIYVRGDQNKIVSLYGSSNEIHGIFGTNSARMVSQSASATIAGGSARVDLEASGQTLTLTGAGSSVQVVKANLTDMTINDNGGGSTINGNSGLFVTLSGNNTTLNFNGNGPSRGRIFGTNVTVNGLRVSKDNGDAWIDMVGDGASATVSGQGNVYLYGKNQQVTLKTAGSKVAAMRTDLSNITILDSKGGSTVSTSSGFTGSVSGNNTIVDLAQSGNVYTKVSGSNIAVNGLRGGPGDGAWVGLIDEGTTATTKGTGYVCLYSKKQQLTLTGVGSWVNALGDDLTDMSILDNGGGSTVNLNSGFTGSVSGQNTVLQLGKSGNIYSKVRGSNIFVNGLRGGPGDGAWVDLIGDRTSIYTTGGGSSYLYGNNQLVETLNELRVENRIIGEADGITAHLFANSTIVDFGGSHKSMVDVTGNRNALKGGTGVEFWVYGNFNTVNNADVASNSHVTVQANGNLLVQGLSSFVAATGTLAADYSMLADENKSFLRTNWA